MDLKTFIKETLVQISEGMIEAQNELREKGVLINPRHKKFDETYTMLDKTDGSQETLQEIKFDIAITVENAEDGGRFSVGIAAVTLSAGTDKKETNASMSRVSFCIPARLPQSTSGDNKTLQSTKVDQPSIQNTDYHPF